MLIGEKFYNAFASLRLTIVLTVHNVLLLYNRQFWANIFGMTCRSMYVRNYQ